MTTPNTINLFKAASQRLKFDPARYNVDQANVEAAVNGLINNMIAHQAGGDHDTRYYTVSQTNALLEQLLAQAYVGCFDVEDGGSFTDSATSIETISGGEFGDEEISKVHNGGTFLYRALGEETTETWENTVDSKLAGIDTSIDTITGDISTLEGNVSTLDAAVVKKADITQSLSDNGYTKLSNGMIIQWGVATITPIADTIVNVTVTLPIAFPNNFCSVTATPSTTVPDAVVCSVNALTNTNFKIYFKRPDTTVTYVYWSAIGY